MRCKKIQEQEKIKLQLISKKKVQKLKEKGITLIALVVTIIILLILAGVTLNMALSGDGLFSKARNAADKYKKAQEDEQDLISEIGKEMNSEYVGAYVIGYIPDKITFENDNEVPDNIATNIMEFEESEEDEIATMKWRIWDFDGEVLRLISATPTSTKLELNGEDGYNYGIYEMNQICRDCFGQHNGKELKNGINVTNLRRSDIQKVSTYDYTNYQFVISKEDGTEKTIKFGDTIDKFEFKSLPEMWRKCDSEWSVQEDPECFTWEKELPYLENENNDSSKIKHQYYGIFCQEEWRNSISSEYQNLLLSDMKNATYWTATRDAAEGIDGDVAALGMTSIYCPDSRSFAWKFWISLEW